MTVFSDLQTVLETTGSKVFANKKLDSVKTCIVYQSIGQRIIGTMSGDSGMRIERVQITCCAINESTLQNMAKTVEDTLAYYNTLFTSIPAESSKVEGFNEKTSTFFSHRDFYILY